MPMILVFGNLRHKDCHEKPTPAPFSGEDPGISFADLSIFHLPNLHSSVSAAGQQGPPEATLAGTQVRDPHCLPILYSNVFADSSSSNNLPSGSFPPVYPHFLGTPPVAVAPVLLAFSCRASQYFLPGHFHSFVSHGSPQKLSLRDLSAA